MPTRQMLQTEIPLYCLYNKKIPCQGVRLFCKGRYTRGSLLLKHVPETRSRVSTPTSTHEGHDERKLIDETTQLGQGN